MDFEVLFGILFILVLLAIPSFLGLGLWKAVNKRAEIEALFSQAQYALGNVIGYTQRRYDPENTHDHFVIIKYQNGGKTIWAEGDSCNKGDFLLNSEVKIMFHQRDPRYVKMVISNDILKMQVQFEQYIGLALNLVMTVLIFGAVFYYYGAGWHMVVFLLCYVFGFLFGVITKMRNKLDEQMRINEQKHRDIRLTTGQKQGDIPCFLNE